MTKLVWPKQIGQPLIPLSPHNNEISDIDARSDQEFFQQKERAKESQRKANLAAKRSGRATGVSFVSKIAQRPDDDWERRIWNTLNSKGLSELEWDRRIKNETGERTFQSTKRKIRVLCDLSAPGSWLVSPGRRLKYEWVLLKVGKDRARPQDIAVLQSLLWEIVAEQSKLRDDRHA